MRTMAALALAFGVLALAAGPTAACSPHVPTFADVVASDSPIVIGRVIGLDSTHLQDGKPAFVVRVERVVRGEVGETVIVRNWSTFCRDGLRERGRMMIALDVPFGGPLAPFRELAPFWEIFRGRVTGVIEENPPLASLGELADHIATLPDTSTLDVTRHDRGDGPAWLPALAGLMALVLFVARPLDRGHRATPLR